MLELANVRVQIITADPAAFLEAKEDSSIMKVENDKTRLEMVRGERGLEL
jgi:hypothetical protein